MTEGHPTTTAGAIGLIRLASRRVVSIEPFFMEFLTGLEETLAVGGTSVLLTVVADEKAEKAMYQRWAAGPVVDAVLVMDVRVRDPRPALLAQLGLPAVVVGAWDGDPGFPVVHPHDAGSMETVAEHLLDLGHRSLAHVTGPRELVHTRTRREVLSRLCRARGVRLVTVEGDYSDDSGARLTASLLAGGERPTAIVYDNDVMAVAGLQTALRLGVRVPDELSLVGWDDSALCRLTFPPLTTMTLDVHALGARAGAAVLGELGVAELRAVTPVPPTLSVRGTTAPPGTAPDQLHHSTHQH